MVDVAPEAEVYCIDGGSRYLNKWSRYFPRKLENFQIVLTVFVHAYTCFG